MIYILGIYHFKRLLFIPLNQRGSRSYLGCLRDPSCLRLGSNRTCCLCIYSMMYKELKLFANLLKTMQVPLFVPIFAEITYVAIVQSADIIRTQIQLWSNFFILSNTEHLANRTRSARMRVHTHTQYNFDLSPNHNEGDVRVGLFYGGYHGTNKDVLQCLGSFS